MRSSGAVGRGYLDYRRIFDGRSMPFAFVDRDLLDRNAAAVLRRAGGKPVRVATKSVRCEALLRWILRIPGFRGLMSFTAPEAVHLAAAGFDDILVAYPTVDPSHLDAVAEAAGAGASICLMADCIEHLERIEAAGARRAVRMPVCLEVDMSWDLPGLRFGVWRSPVRSAEGARRLAGRALASEHLALEGLMGYEAQIAGLPDRAPGNRLRTTAIRRLKRGAIRRVAGRRAEVVGAVRDAGASLRFVNGGGTGSLESSAAEDVVTEVTAGSAFFSPGLFDHYDAFRHLPAAGFALQVVRRPAPHVYTCLGGGYVASGAAGPDKLPVPYLPRGARLLPTEGAGEVQTPVRYRGPEPLRIGDPVFLRHAKAGELCERFDRLLVVAGDGILDEVPTYRGGGLTFL